MEISKNTKTVTLTKEELTDAIRVYLLAKDVEGTVTNVNTKEADRSLKSTFKKEILPYP